MYYICQDNMRFKPTCLVLNVADYSQSYVRHGMDDRDPWICDILLRIPALKDLTLFGLDFIMSDMFDDVPNLTALRLYSHHENVYLILPESCRNIITLEFVGEFTFPRPIVQHLLTFKFTPLRALAIITPHKDATVNVIKALGMY